jgi:hypothetical protein
MQFTVIETSLHIYMFYHGVSINEFLFVVLQLLGCHGPLANRQPGQAFLNASVNE